MSAAAGECSSAPVPINPGLSIARVFKGHKGPVTRAVPVPSGGAGFSQYASSGGDGSVIIWSTKHNTRPLRCEGHSDRVTAVAADASGRWIASAGVDKTDLMLTCSDDKTVKLWKMPVGGDRKAANLQDRKFLCSLVGHSNWVLTCAFSADAASAVSGGEDRTVRVWDIETKTNFACFYDNTLSVRSVTFSPVTPQLVGAAGDDGSINFWDTRLPTGKQLVQRYSPAHDRGSVLSIALRPDNGHLLASGGRQGDIRLWDLREGRRIACVAQGKAEAAARLPPVNSVRWCQDVDGRYELIIGSADGQVYIWDIEDSIILPMRAPTPVLADPRPSEGPLRGYSTSPAPVAFTRSEAAATMSRTLDLGSVTTEAVPKAMEAVGDQLLRTMELIEKRVQLMEDKVANLELNLRAPQSPLKLENMPRDANQAVPDETTGA
ncbi:POC1 centriolar protein A [Perkinsus olseni]|uniref:POC1 centriolar protein A n=1 Tax=Perkinsus olseni TaxID=32597 RepID=A0A7J6RIG8_PEROL|nr:POC1 centriolar protein A [Perkinsus olseni]